MKYIAIAALLILLQAPPPMPRDTMQSHRDTEDNQEKNSAPKNPPAPPSQVIHHQTHQTETETQPQAHTTETSSDVITVNHDSPKKDWWDRASIIGGLFVAVLTFGLAILARSQAIAAKVAADAAKLNAQAVINAERPWFVITIEGNPSWKADENRPLYNTRFTNKGRTPGVLDEMFQDYIFVESPNQLPSPPVYSTPCIGPNDTFFANGESYTITPAYAPNFMTEEWVKNTAHSPVDMLIVYGTLTYRDTLVGKSSDVIHETKWCYFWSPDKFGQGQWVRCGLKEYTGHTDHQRDKA